MKILLATDGSKYSEAATQRLGAMFRSEGAEVLVLQVVEPPVFSAPPQMARSSRVAPSRAKKRALRLLHWINPWVPR